MDIIKLKKLTSIDTYKYIIVIGYPSNKNKEEALDYGTKKLIEIQPTLFNVKMIYIGNLLDYKDYKDVVAKFKKKAYGGIPIYRNYCISEEEQRKRMGGCNVAQDPKTSLNTVISALGSPNGIILIIETNDTRSSEIIQTW